MKIKSSLIGLTIIALSVSSAFASSVYHWQDINKNTVVIDARQSEFYNGWPDIHNASGHEPKAINFSAHWLQLMDNHQIKTWLTEHHIKSDQPIAIYGEKNQINQLIKKFNHLGYQHTVTISDALKTPDRLVKLPNYQILVYPQWIYHLQQNKFVANAPISKKWKIVEVGWGVPKAYLLGHIPDALYLDTNDIESQPLWNLVSTEKLQAALLKLGITADTTVILYSRNTGAAERAAHAMLYLGVQDVRLLDGGWETWKAADYPIELGLPKSTLSAKSFGITIPAHPELLINLKQAKKLLHRQDASLVSIRSWPEYIGETSGYSYIKPKGDIAGARWGHGGSDANHLEDFHNPDGTMRSADDISAMWSNWNINKNQTVAFYCGTGWRASAAFIYAKAMGWKNISVYDGGWYEWSSNPKNPIVTGERTVEQTN